MDKLRAYSALLQTAQKSGITIEQAIAEIEFSINEAINTAKANNNQAALNQWKLIPCKNEYPTALELIAYLGEKIKSESI